MLDGLSWATDRGDWAKKFICRADEQIDRLGIGSVIVTQQSKDKTYRS